MLKKFLILPLIGGIFGFGAFASADSITFVSDGQYLTPNSFKVISSVELSSDNVSTTADCSEGCSVAFFSDSDLNNQLDCYLEIYDSVDAYDCNLSAGTYYVGYNQGSESLPASFVISSDNITFNSSDNGGDSSDSSTVFPTIPSSFTSGITALVNNFGSVFVGWLPSIILVALGIVAIFSLFRVVRNYARSSFRG